MTYCFAVILALLSMTSGLSAVGQASLHAAAFAGFACGFTACGAIVLFLFGRLRGRGLIG